MAPAKLGPCWDLFGSAAYQTGLTLGLIWLSRFLSKNPGSGKIRLQTGSNRIGTKTAGNRNGTDQTGILVGS